jgi:quercetin dioxygenase-like cupin family protein
MRPWVLLSFVGAAAASALAQDVVHVSREPRHRQVLATPDLRVLDVNVPPGDTTLFHEHTSDLALVRIGVTATRAQEPGQPWGPARPTGAPGDVSATDYTGKPSVHRVENIGEGLYRLIAVENLREEWGSPAPVSDPATVLVTESRAFRLYRVTLGPQAEGATHRHAAPVVMVLVEGEAINRRDEQAEPEHLGQPGQLVLIAAGVPHVVRRSRARASLVEVELR